MTALVGEVLNSDGDVIKFAGTGVTLTLIISVVIFGHRSSYLTAFRVFFNPREGS